MLSKFNISKYSNTNTKTYLYTHMENIIQILSPEKILISQNLHHPFCHIAL